MAVGLLGPLTAERGHPWPQGPEALAVPGEAISRGWPADTDVPGPQEQAPLTPSPTPSAAGKRVAFSLCRHQAGEHPAGSKWEPDPRTHSVQLLGSAVGAAQLRSAKWPAFSTARKAAAQALHLPLAPGAPPSACHQLPARVHGRRPSLA